MSTNTDQAAVDTSVAPDDGAISSSEQVAQAIALAQNAVLESQAMHSLDLLDVLLDNFPGGICLYDSDFNLVLHNQQLRTLLNYPDELFERADLTMADLFRFNAERGEYGDGDIDKLVADRLARAKQGVAHVYERTRPDGTVYLMVNGKVG